MDRTLVDQTVIRRQLFAGLSAINSVDGDHAATLNDVGFGKVDGAVARSFLSMDPERWTPAQARSAWKILRRYKNTQLPLFGIDFDAIPEPELPEIAAARTAPAPGARRAPAPVSFPPSRITTDGDRFVFMWPYGEPDFGEKISRVKSLTGRRWNPEAKVWTAPITVSNLEAVVDLVVRFSGAASPFELDDATVEVIDHAADRFTENIRSSHAAAADLVIDGFSAGTVPMPFQLAGVSFVLKNKKVIIGDQMGLGKTLQAIASALKAAAWPVLVVCPSSLKLNWRREFRKWIARDLVIQVLSGKTPYAVQADADVVIINYDLLTAWSAVLSAVRWEMIVADESHKLKNHKAQRTKAFRDILKATEPEYVLLLSGTPFLSRPIEGWTLIDMLGHGYKTFGGWKSYVTRYCGAAETGFGWDVSGASNTEELNQRLRESGILLRRRKQDVLKELPSRRWATVPVQMDVKTAREYLNAEGSLASFVAEQKAHDQARNQAWTAELQAEGYSGAALEAELQARRRAFHQSEAARLEQSEQLIRFEALKQLAYTGKRSGVIQWIADFIESGEKLVVFAHHRAVVLELAAAVQEITKVPTPVIMGGMKAEDVENGKARFMTDERVQVIVCNIAAGGVGHTLTAASNVAFVELGWTPADMDQALDRVHRIGQTENVTGWILVAELPESVSAETATIDGEIADLLEKKRAVVDAATDGSGEVQQVRMMEELRLRLQARRGGQG